MAGTAALTPVFARTVTVQGVTEPPGATRVRGATGTAGAVGAVGLTGVTGAPGQRGSTGAAGAAGGADAAGAAGPGGHAGAPFDRIILVHDTLDLSTNSTGQWTSSEMTWVGQCPAGSVAIGATHLDISDVFVVGESTPDGVVGQPNA